jgi:type IX secretion system PorP/SprF family membrane protein
MKKLNIMKKNIFILVIILLALGNQVHAQQEAMYTHYMYNTLEMNPAYAGSRGALSLVGLQRNQWVGFEGAPVTQGISLNSPIFGEHLAGGLSVGSDKIGPIKTTNLNLSFAYRMKVNEDARLSFGINAGFNSLNTQFSRLDLNTPIDEAFSASGQSEWAPNFGFGMYYSTSKWYAGISAPRLLEHTYKASNVSSVSLMQSSRHYYAIGGALLEISPTVKYRPSFFVKAVSGAPIQVDITNQFIFHDLFWLGSMIRTGDGAGVLAGFNINSSMQFGYAYDWSYGFGRISNHNGSHELMLRYELKYGRQEKIKSPRYF